jgi:hypothetical protein
MRLAWWLVLAAACGRVSGESADGGAPDSSVNPGTYELTAADTLINGTRGATFRLPVRVDRTGGFQGDVTLDLLAAPTGFSATFEPNPVPAGVEDVTAVIVTPRVLGQNPSTLQLHASAPGGEDTLEVTVSLGSIDVSGRVINRAGGSPDANTKVSIPGVGETTIAADGTFTLTGSHAPYEAIVSVPGSTGRTLYVGLTRTDPVLRDYTWHGPTPFGIRFAPVDITVAGVAAGDCNETRLAQVMVLDGKNITTGVPTPAFTGGVCKLTGDLVWPSSFATTITPLYGVFIGRPNGPFAYETATPTLVQGAGTLSFTMSPDALPTGQLRGVVGIPPMATALSLRTSLQLDGTVLGPLFTTTNAGEAVFPKPVPLLLGLRYQVTLDVTVASGSQAFLSRDELEAEVAYDFTLPAPAEPLTPADDATAVDDGTTFSWSTHGTGTLYRIQANPTVCSDPFVCADSRFTVITPATSVTLPFGISAPTGAYTWTVEAMAPGNIDDFATAGGMIDIRPNTTYSKSEAWSFTFE